MDISAGLFGISWWPVGRTYNVIALFCAFHMTVGVHCVLDEITINLVMVNWTRAWSGGIHVHRRNSDPVSGMDDIIIRPSVPKTA